MSIGQPIEVFFCSSPHSMGRYNLAQQMLDLWKKAHFAGLIKLIAYTAPRESRYFFQSNRRKLADAEAKGDIYILTDDDMEPVFPEMHIVEGDIRDFFPLRLASWMAKGFGCMDAHEEFGILSAAPANAIINIWTPEDYAPVHDGDVLEHVDVGGLRFCRKGIIKEWPEQTRKAYDREHCEAIRAAGYRVGYLKHVCAIHHGEGHTEIWQEENQEQQPQSQTLLVQ